VSRDEPARIPGLDEIRAVSISLVPLSHAEKENPHVDWSGQVWLPYGKAGGNIFFVISDLPRFYARRALRIFPPYPVLLLVTAILAGLGWFSVSRVDWFACLTYTRNFLGKSWVLGHAWSLSLEERFYLIFPLALGRFGPKRAAARALNSRAVTWLGRISYSLYLWQQMFLRDWDHPDWSSTRLVPSLLLTFGTALASYHLLEAPLDRHRRRLRPAWGYP